MCVKEGKAASIMSAYNALNDVPCTLNPWLLQKVLRQDWGFQGYVVSDCGGPALLVNAHKYVKTKEAAATLSIKAGLDLECGDDVYDGPLLNAYKQYMVSDADIDSAAYHVLTARMKLGLFDSGERNPYTKISPSVIGSKEHQQIALDAARQCVVLLKNQKNRLPLNADKLKSIAVVGINAGKCEFGDYSGAPVVEPVSILQGIKKQGRRSGESRLCSWKSAADGLELIQGENSRKDCKLNILTIPASGGHPEKCVRKVGSTLNLPIRLPIRSCLNLRCPCPLDGKVETDRFRSLYFQLYIR